MFENILAAIAYGSLILAIVIFLKGSRSDCTHECNQGRSCDGDK